MKWWGYLLVGALAALAIYLFYENTRLSKDKDYFKAYFDSYYNLKESLENENKLLGDKIEILNKDIDSLVHVKQQIIYVYEKIIVEFGDADIVPNSTVDNYISNQIASWTRYRSGLH